MWKYLIDSKYLTWYQRLYLDVYSWYLYFFKPYPNTETLVYKDKGVKGYIQYRGRSVLLHIKKRNKNKLFKRWNHEYLKL